MTNTNVSARSDALRQLLVSRVEEKSRSGPSGRRRTIAGAAALVLAGALAGGAVSAAAVSNTVLQETPATPEEMQEYYLSAIAAFEREAVAGDELPAELPDYARSTLDLETSRFVGEQDGASIYLVQGLEALSPVCVATWRNELEWVVGCGGMPLATGGLNLPKVEVVPAGESLPSGWVQLDDNVRASAG